MNQRQMPLFEALMKWKRKRPYSFHVPGHKNGTVFPSEARLPYEAILSLDATEITGLDDLHEPEGAILEAQRLTAQWYGSKESFFLVGGTTVGNLAMILATCAEQEIVLIQRNSHKSIMHGLEMANAKPVFLTPFVDEEANVPVGVTLETVKSAYAVYPNASVLIITNPNYYGMTIDLEPIVSFAHEHGLIVLVDEAHGAHFGIGEPFPNSAISQGADVVVQSAHKTLPAMTMGSFLHVNDTYPYVEKLKNVLMMLQSSSPSYPIMASLDIARHYISQLTDIDICEIVYSIEQFRQALSSIENSYVVTGKAQSYKQDPLKVIVQSQTGMTGFDLQKRLEQQAIYPELADEFNVLLVMPLAPFRALDETLVHFKYALGKHKSQSMIRNHFETIDNEVPFSSLELSYKEMMNASKTLLMFHEAEGEIAAETVIPYPPGIPLLMKGERITAQHLNMLERYQQIGARFHGGRHVEQNQILIFQ